MLQLHSAEANRILFVSVTTEFRNLCFVRLVINDDLASPVICIGAKIGLSADEIIYVGGASE
jgi:hypothetical protein